MLFCTDSREKIEAEAIILCQKSNFSEDFKLAWSKFLAKRSHSASDLQVQNDLKYKF